jgi:hypothetical protein
VIWAGVVRAISALIVVVNAAKVGLVAASLVDASVVGNAPYGGAGVAANDAADERISAVGIATGGAHRICAEGQSARNEKSGQSDSLISGAKQISRLALDKRSASIPPAVSFLRTADPRVSSGSGRNGQVSRGETGRLHTRDNYPQNGCGISLFDVCEGRRLTRERVRGDVLHDVGRSG